MNPWYVRMDSWVKNNREKWRAIWFVGPIVFLVALFFNNQPMHVHDQFWLGIGGAAVAFSIRDLIAMALSVKAKRYKKSGRLE